MTTPRLGAPELVQNQAVPETTVNETFYWLDAGSGGGFLFLDRDLATPPGSPTVGDTYLVATGGTGAWSGHDDEIAVYINTSWEFIPPSEGFIARVADENIWIGYDGSIWGTLSIGGAASPPYGVSLFFTTTPTASEVLLLHTAVLDFTLPDNFANSVGDVGTNPTGSFVLDVQKNGSSVGSITISTGGAFTFNTTGTTVSFVIGDQLKIVGPSSADATIANVSITLLGTQD